MTFGRELQFSLLKEDWSRYEILEGEAIVWARVVLTKLFEIELPGTTSGASATPPQRGYAPGMQTLATAFFQDQYKADPESKPLPPEELATGGEVVSPVTLDEPWNEYLVQGSPPMVFSIRCVATRIRWFPKHHTATRDPAVQVDIQAVLGVPREARPDELSR